VDLANQLGLPGERIDEGVVDGSHDAPLGPWTANRTSPAEPSI
jgi:hypothetical protein